MSGMISLPTLPLQQEQHGVAEYRFQREEESARKTVWEENGNMTNDYIRETIRARRILARMTQEELARAINVSYYTIKNMESGRTTVPFDLLCRIAEALDCEISDFCPPEVTDGLVETQKVFITRMKEHDLIIKVSIRRTRTTDHDD